MHTIYLHLCVIVCHESVVATIATAQSDIVAVKALQLIQCQHTDVDGSFLPLLYPSHHGVEALRHVLGYAAIRP